MRVTSDFECGNGKGIREVAPGHFRVDEVGEKAPYCKYFCVRLEGGNLTREIRLDVYPDPAMGEEGRQGMLGHYPAPFWMSEDGMRHWFKVTHRWPGADAFADDHITTRVVVPAGGTLYLASNVVYPYSHLRAWAGALTGPGVAVDSLGPSFEGREIPRVRLAATGEPAMRVLVFAGQHPSEHCGPLAACGISEFLLSRHPEAVALRRRCDVWILPNVNPDGNVHGRNGWNVEDVNQCSDFAGLAEGELPRATENRLLWHWLEELRPDLSLEFHGYLGTRRFADPPCDGCYVLAAPDQVYADPERARAYEAVRDALFWDTPGLSSSARSGTLTPALVEYHMARAFGTLVPFYEINHAFHGVQGAKRKGADVFRAVMRAALGGE